MSERTPHLVYAYCLLLVEDGDRYALIQEADPERGQPWYFPAGGVEPGESLLDAARREAREESGLEVELVGLIRFEQSRRVPREDAGEPSRWPPALPAPQVMRFFFLARSVGGALKTVADEHSLRADWFTLEEIARLKLRSPEVVTIIEQHRRERSVLPLTSLALS